MTDHHCVWRLMPIIDTEFRFSCDTCHDARTVGAWTEMNFAGQGMEQVMEVLRERLRSQVDPEDVISVGLP